MPAATQADFDEVVRTNMDDFDMGPEEALAAAVEELALQGLDMTGVVKGLPGTADAHPAARAAGALASLVGTDAAGGGAAGADADAVSQAVGDLAAAVTDADGATIAARAAAVDNLLAASKLTPAPAHAALATLLRAAPGSAARDAAVAGGGCEAALAALAAAPPASSAWEAASALAAALATGHEGAKATFVTGGLGRLVAAGLTAASTPAVVDGCAAVAACATADDARPITSSAFQHGRALAGDGALPAALLAVVGDPASPVAAAAAAARAARRILVNDDLARAAAGLGGWPAADKSGGRGGATTTTTTTTAVPPCDGVAAVLTALRRGTTSQPACPASARLAKSAAGLARQLAGSDPVKPALIEGGIFDLLAAAVPAAAASGRHGLVEQALGAVVALTLRNPEGAAAAVAAGIVPAIAAVLAGAAEPAAKGGGAPPAAGDGDGGEEEEEHEGAAPRPAGRENAAPTTGPTSTAAKAHQWAVRQACAAARNLAARSGPDGPVAAALSSARLTPLLRAARRRYPDACGDVGAAALRDLGVEDYNAA